VTINQAAEGKDASSVLNHFRQAIALRKDHAVLIYGQYQLLNAANPHIYTYTRTQGAEKVLVILNFLSAQRTWNLPADLKPIGEPLHNNYPILKIASALALQPWQAVVVKIQ
jgi:oligo-1,6-glucosidase